MRLVGERVGWHPPYDADIADVLGWPLRHPEHPDKPLTIGMIASHTASLSDAAGYQIPTGTSLQDWFRNTGTGAFLPHRPGSYFSYSNLGYILLAAVAEAITGERFDQLAQRLVLGPFGIAGGFNWSGVPATQRRTALPTYRRDSTGLHPQIDHTVAAQGISGPDGTEIELSGYQPRTNPGPFSPQGGLRLSLSGALTLAQSLATEDATPLWSPKMGPGDTGSGVFDGYGMGLQIFDNPNFYPRPLIGHFANAYGFTGGVWWDRQAGAAFAYALNGLPIGDEDDDFGKEELAIFAAVAQALD